MLLPVVAISAVMMVAAQSSDRGRELVENVCTYCHNLDRLRGKELSREAVSYTHLDVYKRQTMIFIPLVAAAKRTAFSKIGIMRYFPPVFLASLSSMAGSR